MNKPSRIASSEPGIDAVDITGAVETCSKRYRHQLRNLCNGDGGAVHDFRVASRRLVAALDLALAVADDRRIQTIRREVKSRFSDLGRLRDMEVEGRLAGQFQEDHPELAVFTRWLSRRRTRAWKELRGDIEGNRFDGMRARTNGLAGRVRRNLSDVSRAKIQKRIMKVVRKRLTRAGDALNALAIDRPETFHQLRIAIKRVRYVLEPLAEMDTEGARAWAGFLLPCRDLQDRLGLIQDLDVLRGDVESRAKLSPELAAAAGAIAERRDREAADFLSRRGAVASVLAAMWEQLPSRKAAKRASGAGDGAGTGSVAGDTEAEPSRAFPHLA